MIRILIADDHAIVRSGLRQIFEQIEDFAVHGEVANGCELLERLPRGAPDILLMDLDMPGISGAELIRHVKQKWPQLPILVLSMHNEPKLALRALKAGASGYITKDSNLDILLPAIRTVASHKTFIAPGLAQEMVFEDTRAAKGKRHNSLSDRELQVFNLLVSGMTVNEIAERLSISNKTVSTHKAKMLEKMQMSSVAELARYAMKNDLMH
ncbi:MAG: response regulator transcription factor [Rhodoferax sp.]|nr:response regulator transcription factor [Rhodoferax sp.]MCF8207917.1 response regulator transcription factor [Rhodoferax sp.]